MDTISLGRRTGIPVVPQRHARLRNRLSAQDFNKLMTGDYAAESYRLLCILIPALDPATGGDGIPLWEWEGYGSQEAMDAGNYVDDDDHGPTTAEIVNAFETALMVAGAGRLGKIMSLVESVGTLTSIQTQTQPSPASPGSNGE